MIQNHERKFERVLYSFAAVAVPGVIAAFIWLWSTHAAQAAFNAGVAVKIDQTAEYAQESRDSRVRVEARLDEINRFLREDSRELRDQLNAHIREARDQ